jgi:hypothetical protein
MGIFPLRLSRLDLRKTPRYEIHFPAHINVGDQSPVHACI